jgi:hypothetical protein
MSSPAKNDGIARSAARLRMAVFVTMGAMVVLYIAARLGLQFGHARVIYEEHGPGTLATRLISDVCVGLLVVALFRLTEVLKRIADGDLFGIEVIRRFRSFAWWLLLMSVLELIGPTLGQFVDAPKGGPHQVRFAIDSRDLLFLGITIFLFLLARLLERARAIDEEMREIV